MNHETKVKQKKNIFFSPVQSKGFSRGKETITQECGPEACALKWKSFDFKKSRETPTVRFYENLIFMIYQIINLYIRTQF